MSAADVELVRRALGPNFEAGHPADLVGSFGDPVVRERLEALLAPDASIEFATPDGGFVGEMAGPFAGLEGFLAGWAEWLEPWDSFVVTPLEWIDAGEGRVLLLSNCHGRLAGSGVELDTPRPASTRSATAASPASSTSSIRPRAAAPPASTPDLPVPTADCRVDLNYSG